MILKVNWFPFLIHLEAASHHHFRASSGSPDISLGVCWIGVGLRRVAEPGEAAAARADRPLARWVQEAPVGTRLAKQGNKLYSFFVIVSGEVRITLGRREPAVYSCVTLVSHQVQGNLE